jgi:hypothetical protein
MFYCSNFLVVENLYTSKNAMQTTFYGTNCQIKKLLIVYGTNFHCNAMTAMEIIETSILRPLLPNKLVGQ